MEENIFTRSIKSNALTVAKQFFYTKRPKLDPLLLYNTEITSDTFQWLVSLYSLSDKELIELMDEFITRKDWDKLRLLHGRFPHCLVKTNIDSLLESCIETDSVTNVKWLIGISKDDFLVLRDKILRISKDDSKINKWIKDIMHINDNYKEKFVRDCIQDNKRETQRYRASVGLISVLTDFHTLRRVIINATTSTVRWLIQSSVSPTDIAISQHNDIKNGRESSMLSIINSATLSLYFPSRIFYEACIHNDIECLEALVKHVPKGIIMAKQMFYEVCIFGFTDIAKILVKYDGSVFDRAELDNILRKVDCKETYLWLAQYYRGGIVAIVKSACDRNDIKEAQKLKSIVVGFRYKVTNGSITEYSIDNDVKKIVERYPGYEIIVEEDPNSECLVCFSVKSNYYIHTCANEHWICTECFLKIEQQKPGKCVFCTVPHSKLRFAAKDS